MDSFIIELVSSASTNVYPENTLASFSNFLPDQLTLEGNWEVALLEISYPSLYNNITDGKFWYVNNPNKSKETKETNPATGISIDYDPLYIQPGLYMSLDEILTSMNNSLKKKRSTQKVDLKWSINQVSRKVDISLPSKDSHLVISSPDLSTILGFPSNVWLKGIGPHQSLYPIDILRIHSVMVYTDIVEYSVIGDTKAPVLRCFPFEQRLSRDRISVTKFISNNSFDNLQFRRLLRNSIHSIRIELRTQTGELIPFVSVGLTRVSLLFRKQK